MMDRTIKRNSPGLSGWVWLVLLTLLLANGGTLSIAGAASGPQDAAASISVGSVSVATGGAGITDVQLSGYSGTKGLGAYDLKITFDRTKINVLTVAGSDTPGSPFSATPTSNSATANTTGQLSFSSFHNIVPGPAGPTIKIARITWQGLVAGTHALTLTITSLMDTAGDTVTGVSAASGAVTVTTATMPPPTPSPSPVPGPSPTPTPSPTPVPLPNMTVSSITVGSGTAGVTDVTINGYSGARGIGAYDIRISFDKTRVNVISVGGSDSPGSLFSSVPTSNATSANTTGQLLLSSFHNSIPGATGPAIKIARVAWKGVATGASALTLSITSLADTSGDNVNVSPVNGAVTVTMSGGSPETALVSLGDIQSVLVFTQSIDADGVVLLEIRISRLRNPATDASMVAAGGIGGYDATITYPGGAAGNAVNILNASGVAPFSSPTVNIANASGLSTFNGFQSGSAPQAPLTLVRVAPRLLGSKEVSHNIVLTLNRLIDVTNLANIPADLSKTFTVRRGDARNDGVITITDALYIAQFLAGIRGIGETTDLTHAVNAASVKTDGATGDKVTITDALLIAQMLAGLRNPSYEPV